MAQVPSCRCSIFIRLSLLKARHDVIDRKATLHITINTLRGTGGGKALIATRSQYYDDVVISRAGLIRGGASEQSLRNMVAFVLMSCFGESVGSIANINSYKVWYPFQLLCPPDFIDGATLGSHFSG